MLGSAMTSRETTRRLETADVVILSAAGRPDLAIHSRYRSPSNMIVAPVGGHSLKSDQVYEIFKAPSAGP